MSDLEFNEQKGNHMGEGQNFVSPDPGETIDGGAPYPADWKDELQPVKESDEKGFFVEPGGEGDVNYRSAETGQFVSEEEAEAHPETTVAETKQTPVTEKQGINPEGISPKLRKRSIVLNLQEEAAVEGAAYFAHFGEDGRITDGYHMTLEMWDDFGRPDTITIVVYPRDMLN